MGEGVCRGKGSENCCTRRNCSSYTQVYVGLLSSSVWFRRVPEAGDSPETKAWSNLYLEVSCFKNHLSIWISISFASDPGPPNLSSAKDPLVKSVFSKTGFTALNKLSAFGPYMYKNPSLI